MIWIIIILVIVVVSFILALRSMKNYQELPTTKFPYGVFLIRNENLVTQNTTLNNLYRFSLEANAIISLERLVKGQQQALVLYAPLNIDQFVPELELLEIEDYLEKEAKGHPKKASVDEVIAWSITPKNEQEITLAESVFTSFTLDEHQQLFWQLVLNATKKENQFQTNIRVMILDRDIHQRIQLAKKVLEYITTKTRLEKRTTDQSITAVYDEFKKRSLVPTEVEGFVLSTQTIKQLF